jgi:SAM-dependent methyltransferase
LKAKYKIENTKKIERTIYLNRKYRSYLPKINKILKPIAKILSKSGYLVLDLFDLEPQIIQLNKYKNNDDYRDMQIFANVMKLGSVWATEKNISLICEAHKNLAPLNKKDIIKGENLEILCHGVRNGEELKHFESYFADKHRTCKVIGTDISPTAKEFENCLVWDFHDECKEWIGNFDIVYSNSLDQASDPQKAIINWVNQLKPNGILAIESSPTHGLLGNSPMDPFSLEPELFPFWVLEISGGEWSVIQSISPIKGNKRIKIFIIKKIVR